MSGCHLKLGFPTLSTEPVKVNKISFLERQNGHGDNLLKIYFKSRRTGHSFDKTNNYNFFLTESPQLEIKRIIFENLVELLLILLTPNSNKRMIIVLRLFFVVVVWEQRLSFNGKDYFHGHFCASSMFQIIFVLFLLIASLTINTSETIVLVSNKEACK